MSKQTIQLEGGDELDIELPEEVVVDGRQRVRILRGTVYEQQWMTPECAGVIGGPTQANMRIGGNHVNVKESEVLIEKGFQRRSLFGRRGSGMSPEMIAGPSYQDRGQIVDASYEPVHPHQQYQALPAPSGPAPLPHSRPLAIAHQPEQGLAPQMAGNRKFRPV